MTALHSYDGGLSDYDSQRQRSCETHYISILTSAGKRKREEKGGPALRAQHGHTLR